MARHLGNRFWLVVATVVVVVGWITARRSAIASTLVVNSAADADDGSSDVTNCTLREVAS